MTSNLCFRTGNRYRHPNGHTLVHCPEHPCAPANGYLPEHRLVMEQSIGRLLTPGEKIRHRNRNRSDNRLENLQLISPQSLEEQFWEHVEKTPSDQCWEWTGNRHRQGYGMIWRRGKTLLAHRVSFAIAYGEISPSLCVCHRCDNPPCVNPAHLFAGTQLENMADRRRKRRGHALSLEKLTQARELWSAGTSQREIAKKFGVSYSTVTRALQTGPARGERNGHAKLSHLCVNEIRSISRLGIGVRLLGRLYGVNSSAIANVLNGKNWRHVQPLFATEEES